MNAITNVVAPTAAAAAVPVNNLPGKVQAIPKHVPSQEEQVMWKAQDKTAVAGAPNRRHLFTMPDGSIKTVEFEADKWSNIPMVIAKKLIGNDGFIVKNERGQELRIVKATEGDDNSNTVLAFDETIAKFEELTIDALILRADRAGKKFPKSAGREKMISFLCENSSQLGIDDESDLIEDDEEEIDA